MSDEQAQALTATRVTFVKPEHVDGTALPIAPDALAALFERAAEAWSRDYGEWHHTEPGVYRDALSSIDTLRALAKQCRALGPTPNAERTG